MIALLFHFSDELWIHVVSDRHREPLMDVVQVGIELIKLVVEQILVVCDVQVRFCCCIDEAVLLTDCKNVFLKTESLEVVNCDCSDLQAFRAFDILLYGGVFVE